MIVSPSLSPSHLKKPLAGQLEKNSNSVLMQDIFNKVLRLSRRETHVIIIGEIGTGKKWLARIIHENSQRASGPFHSFYCVDIDESERSEEHTSELQSRGHLVCRLLLEKKKKEQNDCSTFL